MATHDYVISNGTGSAVRSDINNVLAAIVSNNSASSEPSTKYAYQFWADTNTSILKIRNSANNAWINLFTLAGGIDVDAASNFNEDVTFTGASYNVVWDKSDNALEFADNAKCTFGAPDLSIYHNGTNTFLENDTGYLYLKSDYLALRSASAENYIGCESNAAVQLYYDNVKKFETKAGGIKTYGGAIEISAPEGADANLYMYADESDDNADNWLIQAHTTGFWGVKNYASGSWEKSIIAVGAGAFEAYYDNSLKFETLSGGCKVTGNLLITGSTAMDDNVISKWGTGDDLEIYFDGSTSYIKGNGASCGSIIIDNSADADQNIELKAGQDVYLKVSDGTEVGLRCERGGKTYAYYDNSVKWRTQSWGAQLTGNFLPDGNDNYNLGASGERWSTVYSVNSLNTSDRNEKNTIIKSDLGLDFINKLKPVSYKWNKDDGKTHYGLIAQDIEETVLDEGKAITDVGFIDKPSQGQMSLAYNELFSPLIKAIQELSAKVEALESA